MTIVGDAAALRQLGRALLHVGQTPAGYERLRLHTSDGHEYTAMIVCSVAEEEWQAMPPAYGGASRPSLQVLADYDSVVQELHTTHSGGNG